MQKPTISFIGAGNMATSLIKGLLADGYPAKNIWATNHKLAQLNILENLGINLTTNNREAVSTAKIVILAIKPQILKSVAIEIADLVREKKPLVISIAVGISLKNLQNYFLDETVALIRCMPNTPALLGCGATGLLANSYCSSTQKNTAEAIFRSTGIIVWLTEENQIDVVAALSGSGPAYFFLFMEALQQAGIELGLSAENAMLLTQQTALGAARMAIESKVSIEQLRKNVTSPGGTTQRAIEILNQAHFSELVKKAVIGAKERAAELAKHFSDE